MLLVRPLCKVLTACTQPSGREMRGLVPVCLCCACGDAACLGVSVQSASKLSVGWLPKASPILLPPAAQQTKYDRAATLYRNSACVPASLFLMAARVQLAGRMQLFSVSQPTASCFHLRYQRPGLGVCGHKRVSTFCPLPVMQCAPLPTAFVIYQSGSLQQEYIRSS